MGYSLLPRLGGENKVSPSLFAPEDSMPKWSRRKILTDLIETLLIEIEELGLKVDILEQANDELEFELEEEKHHGYTH